MQFKRVLSVVLAVMLVAGLTASAIAEDKGYIEPPSKWDMTYDVVVVGSGFAGLSAAYAAATAGASTLLIEKMPYIGGNSAINGGVYASYTSKLNLAEKLGLPKDTPEQHIADTLKGGDNMGDPALVEQMVKGAPEMLNILIDNGLKLRNQLTKPGGHNGYRTHTTENQSGSDIVKVLYNMVKGAGVEVKLNTKMVYIYREKPMAGRVLGIKVETKDGVKNIRATKGVILATGGFAANPEMRKTYVPWMDESIPTTNHPGATGEGIILAQQIGANTLHMSYIQLYPFADPNTGKLDKYAVIPFNGPSAGIVYVDVQGKRYVNEGERRDVCSMAAMKSGGFPTFAIFNEAMIPLISTKEDVAEGVAKGRILKADTLEELAAKINAGTYKGQKVNMPASNLVETIKKHNEYVEKGVDPEFGKKIDKGIMKPMLSGPYYAIPQWPSAHHTMGGLKINPKAQVLDVWGDVIPGLFAAGEVVGGIHGTNRLGSNAVVDCLVFGRIAGIMAATGQAPVFK